MKVLRFKLDLGTLERGAAWRYAAMVALLIGKASRTFSISTPISPRLKYQRNTLGNQMSNFLKCQD